MRREATRTIIQFVGTNNSARDMDTIRRALGEDEISFFGFSYGSELGGTWATLFPDTVRAAVLDGAADPNADAARRVAAAGRPGSRATLTTFLAQCSANPDCAFHNDGDAEGAFDQLMLKIDEKPLPTTSRPPVAHPRGRPPGRRPGDVLRRAVGRARGGTRRRPAGRRRPACSPSTTPTTCASPTAPGTTSLEAFQTIHCMDTAERLDGRGGGRHGAAVQRGRARGSPRARPASYFCTFFPESTDPRVEITGAGAGPIVVCGATGDPATPLESTRNMAERSRTAG